MPTIPQLEEITFFLQQPTIDQIVGQLEQRTGQMISWYPLATEGPLAMYQLINPNDPTESVGLYWTSECYLYLCCEQPHSTMAENLWQTLISLGGNEHHLA